MTRWIALVVVVIPAAVACKDKATDKTAESHAGSAGSGSATGSGSAAGSAAAPGWNGKGPLLLGDGFATPESVLYDAAADVYLVSNINGAPADVDDNGYISRVSPQGNVIAAKWIDGARDTVKLDAPKGMAIAGGVLYVADITVVRTFDARTGEPRGEVPIAGATFLNDVAPAPDGGVLVTDSGLDAKLATTGTDAVYHIGKDHAITALIKNKALGGPNGVLASADGTVSVVTFKSGEILSIDTTGKKRSAKKLPKGQLDGIVRLDNGDLLVSSWEGEAIYRSSPSGEWKPVVAAVKSPADIGFDSKRKRLLVPIFLGNSVLIQPLE